MHDIIEAYRHPSDAMEWLPVEVAAQQQIRKGAARSGTQRQGSVEDMAGQPKGEGEAERRLYYVAHLLEELDVVDKSRTTYATPDFVIKPYLDLEKVGPHQIFRYQGGGDLGFCLSEQIHAALIAAGCTCCYFSPLAGS